MDQIRGVNTRLEVKNNYDELKDNFFSSRIQHTPSIKPMGKDTLEEFHTFNKKEMKQTENKNNEYIKPITNEEYENLTIQYKNTIDIRSNDTFEKNKDNPGVNNKHISNNIKLHTNTQSHNNTTKYNQASNTQTHNIQHSTIKNRPRSSNNTNKSNISNKPNPKPYNKIQSNTSNKPNPKPYSKSYNTSNHIQTKNTHYIMNNPQTYVPEIGMKRKLTNILLNVLNKRNINVTTDLVDEYISRYNIKPGNPDPKILSQIVHELKTLTTSTNDNSISNIEFEKETLQTTHLISIDSINRDISKYPKPNEFKINFNPVTMKNTILKGYIGKSFENVISVQLISAIFPKHIDNGGNNIEDYPYIILEIDELGGNYQSTNDNSSNAFAQISFDIDCGKYKKLISRTDKEYKKKFHPRISINSFTIRIKTPDGVLYNFGNHSEPASNVSTDIGDSETPAYDPNISIDENPNDLKEDSYPPINLIFKITQIQRKLDNMYLHP